MNQETAPEAARLRDGDEVAFLPPVAGGAADCWLSDRPLDVGAAVARVAGPGIGGIVTFLGAVRDHARGREIEHLEYEAYAGMAEREMAEDRRARPASAGRACAWRSRIARAGSRSASSP